MNQLKHYIYTLIGLSLFIFANTFLTPVLGYRAVGFVILLTVLFIGSVTSLGPTLFAALLSATAWNFFFIPPKYTLIIDAPEDILMCITYLVTALVTGFLTNRLKFQQTILKEAEILRQSEELHQTLLNSISHELRTPLTTLMASATAMSDQEITKNPEAIKAIGNELLFASDRLNRVIENLLDMSRLNSKYLTLKSEWHDVRDLIGVSLQNLKLQLQNHKIEIDVPEKIPFVKMDFRFMEHALSNLLLNAAIYSPAGSRIRIIARESSKFLELRIEDQGPGVPIEVTEKIFKKFYRVPGSPPGGTGLGLSIVKSIVDAHHGLAKVENKEVGASFIIQLPIHEMKDYPEVEL